MLIKAARTLVEHGADILARSGNGKTPISCAIHAEVRQYLQRCARQKRSGIPHSAGPPPVGPEELAAREAAANEAAAELLAEEQQERAASSLPKGRAKAGRKSKGKQKATQGPGQGVTTVVSGDAEQPITRPAEQAPPPLPEVDAAWPDRGEEPSAETSCNIDGNNSRYNGANSIESVLRADGGSNEGRSMLAGTAHGESRGQIPDSTVQEKDIKKRAKERQRKERQRERKRSDARGALLACLEPERGALGGSHALQEAIAQWQRVGHGRQASGMGGDDPDGNLMEEASRQLEALQVKERAAAKCHALEMLEDDMVRLASNVNAEAQAVGAAECGGHVTGESSSSGGGLGKEVKEAESALCVICMDQRREMVLVPCGHLVLCRKCSQRHITASKLCPVCKAPVREICKVFS
ncbi:hypothetical protein CYMTET_44155 [Cymbomonas tetramitiformis]|uniref:RING-type domain-containing protein n=1 Tax=Cymbomonas tetramitiformis TaxID=36881 RepID=A0AAE0EZY0_9CHLO|nr:hypothetical protein CYMTET_44155 [Cymbomonas tetramitiformis]